MRLLFKPTTKDRTDPCEVDLEEAAEGVRGRYTLLHYTGRGRVNDCDDGWVLACRLGTDQSSYPVNSREQAEELAAAIDADVGED